MEKENKLTAKQETKENEITELTNCDLDNVVGGLPDYDSRAPLTIEEACIEKAYASPKSSKYFDEAYNECIIEELNR
ncbi:MAG: hypothetical protein MJ247_01290 [Alphaproteobacteria bacterium]|nr:hypothetical protein [Alphaproteobacteria bacterium]